MYVYIDYFHIQCDEQVFREFPMSFWGKSAVWEKFRYYLCNVEKQIDVKLINQMSMKKIVFLSLFALCLPWTLVAQSVDDDLYYVPSKKKKEVKQEKKVAEPMEEIVIKSDAPTTVYSSRGNTTVVVKERKGNVRDVDEYNRRYDSRNNNFVMENDTLYIEEKEQPELDGEWIGNRFEGSEDDYEYATRIIRFRNPRYAISISSPLYWDVVYGLNSWEWNVYTDGLYAYAFPTFTNRLWWNWRYNSHGWWGGYPYYGWGWNSWYGPSWNFGYSWGGWYGGSWWGYHHHYHPYNDGWYHGGGYWKGSDRWSSGSVYTNRRSSGPSHVYRNSVGSTRRSSQYINSGETVRRSMQNNQENVGQIRRSASDGTRRVIGTRSSSSSSSMIRRSAVDRMDASSTRRSIYTRPSSTRRNSYNDNAESARRTMGTSRSSEFSRSYSTESSPRRSSSYSRGSSETRSYSNSNSATRRSYNDASSYSNSRSSSGFSSGSSSRSSSGSSYSGGGGGTSRSSSGGGSTRRR